MKKYKMKKGLNIELDEVWSFKPKPNEHFVAYAKVRKYIKMHNFKVSKSIHKYLDRIILLLCNEAMQRAEEEGSKIIMLKHFNPDLYD
jgi:hypothetical protein